MENLILKKEACKDSTMKCGKTPNCCCDCPKSCAGRLVCPIFTFTPEVKKRKQRSTFAMRREQELQNIIDN